MAKENSKKIDFKNSILRKLTKIIHLQNEMEHSYAMIVKGVKEIKVLVASAQNAPFNMISSSNGT